MNPDKHVTVMEVGRDMKRVVFIICQVNDLILMFIKSINLLFMQYIKDTKKIKEKNMHEKYFSINGKI